VTPTPCSNEIEERSRSLEERRRRKRKQAGERKIGEAQQVETQYKDVEIYERLIKANPGHAAQEY
jgi:hypothetical protein